MISACTFVVWLADLWSSVIAGVKHVVWPINKRSVSALTVIMIPIARAWC